MFSNRFASGHFRFVSEVNFLVVLSVFLFLTLLSRWKLSVPLVYTREAFLPPTAGHLLLVPMVTGSSRCR